MGSSTQSSYPKPASPKIERWNQGEKPGSRYHLAIPHRQYEDQGAGKKTSDSASDKTAKPQRNCAGGDNPRLCSGTEGEIGDAEPSLGEGRICYGEEDGSEGCNAEIDCRGDREDPAEGGPGCRAEERPTIDPIRVSCSDTL